MKRNEMNFDFIGKSKIFYAISISIMIIGLFINIFLGVKLDISFKGGTLMKYSYEGELDREVVEDKLQKKINKDVSVQISDAADNENNILNVSFTQALNLDEQNEVHNAMKSEFPNNKIIKLNVNSLSPSMGKLFFLKCMVAIGLASIFLVLYVAFRFRKIGGFSAGAMSLVALLHDILIAYFTFVVLRIPLNDNFVAVVLSILGYSLNDTIVIFDRIRENRRSMEKTKSIGEIANKSINQSFTRSFNTSLCTFLAIGTVAALALWFNLDQIISFAVPMMVGVVSGCYSSVCICGPLWILWQERKNKKELAAKAKA
ncbi:MAG: protein translocase subunit SecF [Oscillospiraceae bacterium]|nr:protein translocase subunit SecF [Oscillospiraceae bacterium]MDD4413363.1 protein translocase subunit SecF [Oscillospiraceae bacterium]